MVKQHENVYNIDNSWSSIPQKAVNPTLDISSPQCHNNSGTGQTNAYEKDQMTRWSKWQHVANEHDGMRQMKIRMIEHRGKARWTEQSYGDGVQQGLVGGRPYGVIGNTSAIKTTIVACNTQLLVEDQSPLDAWQWRTYPLLERSRWGHSFWFS